MVRRPPPRKKKKKKAAPRSEPKEYEPKTVIMFGRAGALELIDELEQMRDGMPMDERADFDKRPLGNLLRTMKRNA
jgi:hypothetical protein